MMLLSYFHDVWTWHIKFFVPCPDHPVEPPQDRKDLRKKLLHEELKELTDAIDSGDMKGVADGIADLVWVACGTAAEYGIDLDGVWAEVSDANWRKLGSDGEPILRDDGKILKPEGWVGPDIGRVLKMQGYKSD
jgi:predicted HAD superfamily Cof-like phosphohydrolase